MGTGIIDKRRGKRLEKKSTEKKLLALWRKQSRLYEARRNYNKIELEKPERRGYKRFFVLRDDIARGKEAEFFKGLLKLVQNTYLSRDKKFLRKDYKTKKKVPIEQSIRSVGHKEFNKLNLSAKQKSFFKQVWKTDYRGMNGAFYYEFEKDWMFVMKIEPHYITYKIEIDPKIESEIARLRNHIDSQNLLPQISKIMGWKYGWKDFYDYKKRLLEEVTDKMVKDELDANIAYSDYKKVMQHMANERD